MQIIEFLLIQNTAMYIHMVPISSLNIAHQLRRLIKFPSYYVVVRS